MAHNCARQQNPRSKPLTTVADSRKGHERAETAQIYIHADQTLKQQALDRTTPPGIRPGRYRPPDKLLAFLEQLSSQAPGLCRGFRPGHPITLAI